MNSKLNSKNFLRRYNQRLAQEEANGTKLRIFDFDDTLVTSNSRVLVTHGNGIIESLTPAQFSLYRRKPDDMFDYSQFCVLIDAKKIDWMWQAFLSTIEKHGQKGVMILSARTSVDPIREFLDSHMLHDVEATALADSNPLLKLWWIKNKIDDNDKLTHVDFFDDSKDNVRAMKHLAGCYLTVRFGIHHVKARGVDSIYP